MIDDARLDALIQRKLDDELTPQERSELSAAITSDPAARRRHDEFVALEDLLFMVGNSDRSPAPVDSDAALIAASADPVPAEEELAHAGGWLPSLVGAVALAALVWFGSTPQPDRPMTPSPDLAPRDTTVQVASISEGWLAVPTETENPDVQFVWVYSLTNDKPLEPVEGTN